MTSPRQRSQIVYVAPYGGQSFRVRTNAAARERLERFLDRCTDARGPVSVGVTVHEFPDDPDGACAPLVEQVSARLGAARRYPRSSGGYEWLWRVASLVRYGVARESSLDEVCRARDAMFEVVSEHEGASPTDEGGVDPRGRRRRRPDYRLCLRLSYLFRFTRPGTRELLPNQDDVQYPEGASSSLDVSLSNLTPTFLLLARFPFEEPTEEFEDHYRAVVDALGVPLAPSRFKLCVPNATRDGVHNKRMRWEPAAARHEKRAAKLAATAANLVGATDLSELATRPRLRSLTLTGGRLRSLDGIEKSPDLVSLEVHGTAVSDIAALRVCDKLERLEICGALVSDIACLLDLPSLREIVLLGVPLDDASYHDHVAALRARATVTVSPESDLALTRHLQDAGLRAVFYRPLNSRTTRLSVPGVGSWAVVEITAAAVRAVLDQGAANFSELVTRCRMAALMPKYRAPPSP